MEDREKILWKRIFAAAILFALAAGLLGRLFPQSVFYETCRYYAENLYRENESEFSLIKILKNIHYYAYFLNIRLLVPALAFLFFMMISKRTSEWFFVFVFLKSAAVSVHAVLIFGALGMEGIFHYVIPGILSESMYLLAVVEVYFYLEKGMTTGKRGLLCCIVRSFVLLACGAALENFSFFLVQKL
ncbi:MAG: hypothetical protein Q4F21_13010 [Lachnospiraceae bacterium]|nr:hypothetical protein [Lachnospiraceae bacterium]